MVRIPASRTVVPPLPAWWTPRPALCARLASAGPQQLVAVVAPGGSGKTVLLAEWARQAGGPTTAWLGLDRDDADPDRFWSAVLAAVLATGDVPVDSPLHRLHGRVAEAGGADHVDELLDGLELLDPAIRLVLDDVHVLADRQEGVRALARLVRRRPAGLRLVLAARSDPAVGLPRLRVEDGLCELRADDLRFSAREAAVLAAACGVGLTSEDVRTLHRRTEGWAAGLRLALLALRRGGEETAAFLARFSGDERSVADYLGGEILAGLPADDRELLGDISVCARLPGPLAVELSGHAGVSWRLEELAHGLGMIERVDAGEHRVHALLRSHLAADLARRRPARHREQHATAARWWAERGEAAHALRHGEQAEDPALVGALLRRVSVPLLAHGDLRVLRRALAAVGDAAGRSDPHLALVSALVHLDAGERSVAAAWLRVAREAGDSGPSAPDARLEGLRVATELLARSAGIGPRPPGAAALGDAADPVLDRAAETASEVASGTAAEAVGDPAFAIDVPAEPALAGLLHLARGTAQLAAAPRGNAVTARAELDRALAPARAGGFVRLEEAAHAELALAAMTEGDPAGVRAPGEACLAVATRHGRRRSPRRTARTVALLAWADLLGGDPDRAADRCAQALEVPDRLAPAEGYALHAVHGAAVGDLGRHADGLAEARAARSTLGDAPVPPALAASCALLEHRAALLLGNLRAATDVSTWLAGRLGETDEGRLMRAWADAATGRWGAAHSAVAPLHRRAWAPATMLVEVHLLDAEAALRAGDTGGGRAALDAALVVGGAHDVVRPFALAGPRTRTLVPAPHGGRAPTFTARVAAACAALVTEEAPPLSERELVVLGLLPSMLDAPTMADELVVSVNTVKTQIRSIYAKLGVSTRRSAVARARERGLLV